MSDILEDLEIFGLGDEKFKHREENIYNQIGKKRSVFGKKKSHDILSDSTVSKDSHAEEEKEAVIEKSYKETFKNEDKETDLELNKAINTEIIKETELLDNAEEVVEATEDNKEDNRIRYDESELDERIIRAVSEMGFEYMSPIQAAAIPVMLKGKDIIGQAQTGTGKTAAFGIPVLSNVNPDDKRLQAVILCPTRELAMQAADDLRDFAKYMHGVKTLAVYGGQDIMRQIKALSQGVQIVVGTPGRVMDHMRRHTMKMDAVKTLVLDEADEMLDMGFREDIETVLKGMPEDRQTALFSATMPKPILEITRQYQKADAEYIRMTPKEITVKSIEQSYYVIPREMKFEVLTRLIDYYQPQRSLIFANTKRMVDQLASMLKDRGYLADGLHGDLSQNQRDMVMNIFRNGRINILIATDVAARGIDVSGVDCVFNFDIPEDIEYYVHRIGRTGRAGKSGKSFTLCSGRETYKIRDIEKICHTKIEERKVPSAKDITKAKSQKVFAEVIDVIENGDVDSVMAFIQQKVEEGEYTAEQLAAGFMRLKMGKDVEDLKIPERRRGGRDGRGRGSRDGARLGYGRGSRDGARSGYGRDGRSGRGRDGKGHDGKDGRFARDGKASKSYSRDGRSGRDARTKKSVDSRSYDKGAKSFRNVEKSGRKGSSRKDSMKVERSQERFFGRVAIKTKGSDGKFHND
ncbi:MAG: DEAD/DEAH box helicase [Butyrivibrio sp.]|uniref:DEAD/DEAH box helicase n=1 Tax=Butyrivibrio sp. TaxID=28121 RepID=UPI0025D4631F|nr:DEAD/DEAH box helicase [Butyrivibrio sp.]MCR5773148.1 DEAD/DEAH box helicase [Butyrivibrio sp.]